MQLSNGSLMARMYSNFLGLSLSKSQQVVRARVLSPWRNPTAICSALLLSLTKHDYSHMHRLRQQKYFHHQTHPFSTIYNHPPNHYSASKCIVHLLLIIKLSVRSVCRLCSCKLEESIVCLSTILFLFKNHFCANYEFPVALEQNVPFGHNT